MYAARSAPDDGTGRREIEASLPACETLMRIRKSPLPGAGQEYTAAGPAAGPVQLAERE